jgi:SET domain-containing protein 6
MQYNTYGDPPNAYLLRRYGHVDLVPLDEVGRMGNPADEAEVKADVVVRVVREAMLSSGSTDRVSKEDLDRELEAKIEWWLDEGEDEQVGPTILRHSRVTLTTYESN